jgi:hypothetical protein
MSALFLNKSPLKFALYQQQNRYLQLVCDGTSYMNVQRAFIQAWVNQCPPVLARFQHQVHLLYMLTHDTTPRGSTYARGQLLTLPVRHGTVHLCLQVSWSKYSLP